MSSIDPSIVNYPESDGKPVSDGDTQLRQMVRLLTSLQSWFHDRDDVYVGGDLLWYPEEGNNRNRLAPDVFVVPGRPAEPARSSWLQWLEDDVPIRHVIEVLSPSNTMEEMVRKRRWYSRNGVEEFLVFDPPTGLLDIHVRTDPSADVPGLVPIDPELPWRSDLLDDCSYDVEPMGDLFELRLLDPAGRPIESAIEAAARADAAELEIARLRARLADFEAD